ncbi:MAG: efflux RND transporter periplasmic adaptor subunit [Sedimentisphaerales bacterium]|nr:efflux RND transporter periplasmic adaptor subunit [Sedimentisphaerales bacterium]
MRRLGIVIIVAVIIMVLASPVAYMAAKRAAAARRPIIVRVEAVHTGELVEFVSAPGEIEPKTNVEISAKTVARIVELPYEEGDRVTKGDPTHNPPIRPSVLVRLDSKDLESHLLSAQAHRAAQAAQIEVEKARIAGQKASLVGTAASLEQARTDLERQKQLLETRDVSQAAFDQAQLALDDLHARHKAAQHALAAAELNLKVLQHNLEAADASIAQAQEALSYTTITAPIDGVITRINAEVGEMVMTGTMNNPGTVIMVVGDLSQMLVVAQVDEADVGKLDVGQKAVVQIDAYPNEEFTGIVHTIALSHDWSRTMTKYFKTEILLEKTEKRLPSGLTAHVDIETRTHTGVLAVPSQAVMAREIDSVPVPIRESSSEIDMSKTFATVVFRYIDGRAVITPVTIGPSNLTHTIITAGVKEGEKIVVGPYKELEKLKHNQRVKDEREIQPEEEARRTGTKDSNDVNHV